MPKKFFVFSESEEGEPRGLIFVSHMMPTGNETREIVG